MKTIVALLIVFMSLSAMAQFIPQQDIPAPLGMILWSKCNSSWSTVEQSQCDGTIQTAPSNVMWCHCQFRCITFPAPLETGYKLWWSVSLPNTGQGHLYSKNFQYFGDVIGDLTLFCGLNRYEKAGDSQAYCPSGEIFTNPFTIGCSGGGQWP